MFFYAYKSVFKAYEMPFSFSDINYKSLYTLFLLLKCFFSTIIKVGSLDDWNANAYAHAVSIEKLLIIFHFLTIWYDLKRNTICISKALYSYIIMNL